MNSSNFQSPHSRDPKIPKISEVSGFSKFFGYYGVAVVLGYLALHFTGYASAPDERRVIPASVRSSPGGYRSYHIWYTGYHGGK